MSLSWLFKGCSAAGTVFFGFSLLLQGCARFPSTADQSAVLAASSPAVEASLPPLVAWVAGQPPDRYADAILDDPAFGNNVSVQIESHYLSAMGLPCRRVRVNVVVNGSPAETVAVCQDGSGRWFLAPRIWKGAVAGNHR